MRIIESSCLVIKFVLTLHFHLIMNFHNKFFFIFNKPTAILIKKMTKIKKELLFLILKSMYSYSFVHILYNYTSSMLVDSECISLFVKNFFVLVSLPLLKAEHI